MRKIFICTILFQLAFQIHFLIADSQHLRIFPNLPPINIGNICIIKSNKAIAGGNGRIVYFDGEKWSDFSPSIPENVLISKIKAFSLKNIWVFYRKHQNYYHHDCYHFNGERWKKILLPQPFHLKAFSFLDSLRFFAGGGWGSFIYFDGKKAENIKTPLNVHISDIAPFSGQWAYVLTKIKNPPYEKKALYEFKNGRWDTLFTTSLYLRNMKFLNPDSGYLFSTNKECYFYHAGNLKLLETANDRERKLKYNQIKFGKDYVWDADTIWQAVPGGLRPIFTFPQSAQIYPLTGNQFFLLGDFGNSLYYLGRKEIGTPFNLEHSIFKWIIMGGSLSKNPGGTIGVAVYKDCQGKENLYFSKDEELNIFCVVEGKTQENKILERNLKENISRTKNTQLWDSGVFFGDMDNDGDLDAIMTFLRGKSYLFENMGNDYFENVTNAYHFHLGSRISNVVWCDLNNDGYLDFVSGDKLGQLYIELNDGFGQFRDIRKQTGIPDSLRGYNPALADVDNDGDLDLFLYGVNNPIHYFENTGIKTSTGLPWFLNQDKISPQLTTRFDFFTHSMRFADFDNDGDLDLFLANRVSPTKLFENKGNGIFIDVSAEKGFNQRLMAYGANWGDLNLDGWPDLFVTTMGKNYIYWNQRGLRFEIDSTAIPLNGLTYSIGSVLTDLDDDGDLDIVVGNYQFGRNCIYRNMLNSGNYVKIGLRCRQSNTYGLGAKVYLYDYSFAGDSAHLAGLQEVTTNTGYASSKLPDVYFGFPHTKKCDVLVKFPSGCVKTWRGLIAGRSYILYESDDKFSFAALGHIAASYYMNPIKRRMLIKIVYFFVLLIVFNFLIFRTTYWDYPNYFFFNLVMLFVFTYLFYILGKSEYIFYNFSAYLLPAATGAILYILLNKSQKLRFSEADQWKLFDLIRQLNHTHSGIKQIDHLIFFLNNIQQNPELKEELEREYHYFKSNSLAFLKSIHKLTVMWNFNLARESKIARLRRYFLNTHFH